MAGPVKSFADLQRELITTQMAHRRAATRDAAATFWQDLSDELGSTSPPAKLTVVKGERAEAVSSHPSRD